MKIQVFYSPQPDEEPKSSAAYEYSQRILSLIPSQISIHQLDIDNIYTMKAASDDDKCFNIIILSCSADGSVDRVVRKLLRKMKSSNITNSSAASDSSEEMPNMEGRTSVAVALLGHARCENSAQQMKDTIYNTGRKFGKQIQEAFLGFQFFDTLEVQAELDGPDMPGGFDEWLQSSFHSLQ
jgi:hypothetical protein